MMQADMHVQGSSFTNVNAVNLFWTSGGAMVVVEGMSYSNVTTQGNRWDVAGSPVGPGNGTNIVLPYGQPPERPTASGSLPSAVQTLSIGDAWIVSVRQVLA